MRKKLLLTLLIIITAISAAGVFPSAASPAVRVIRLTGPSTSSVTTEVDKTFSIVIGLRDPVVFTQDEGDFILEIIDFGDFIPISSNFNFESPVIIFPLSEYRITFRVPSNSPRFQNITYRISYTFEDADGRIHDGFETYMIPVEVLGGNNAASQPILENIALSSRTVPVNEDFSVSADIFNGNDTINDTILSVNRGGVELARRFLGTVSANDILRSEELVIPGISEAGTHTLTVTLSYKNRSGESQTINKNITVNTNAALSTSFLRLLHISHPLDFIIDESATITVHASNPSDADITGMIVFLYDGNTLVDSRYISGVTANSPIAIPITFPVTGNAGSRTYRLVIDYFDNHGTEHNIESSFTINVKQSANQSAGTIRLQNIMPPLKAELDTITTVPVALTNSSDDSVFGAELSIFDENNIRLFSLFISEIIPNSTHHETLSFYVTGRTGSRNYELEIYYNDIKTRTPFSLTAVAEGSETDERPADIRIQSIDIPSQIFTGVRTNIPFTLANAGRGTAYSVEIFVIDQYGNEVAREFVGSIPPQGSREGIFPLRFNSPDSLNLTFYAVAENADESFSQTSRAFELRVADYRVSITDVAGYEWIWNNMTTIEFVVINSGNEAMLNVSAELADAEGNVFRQIYIGNIPPNDKTSRERFRDVFIWDNGAGFMELFINITYENADLQEFSISHSLSATFMSDGGWDMPPDWDDDRDNPWGDFEEEAGNVWTVVLVIGISALVIGGIVTLIVVKKKRKTRDEDDDIDYFLSQMKMDNSPAEKEEMTQ
jgi:hypothetical protein